VYIGSSLSYKITLKLKESATDFTEDCTAKRPFLPRRREAHEDFQESSLASTFSSPRDLDFLRENVKILRALRGEEWVFAGDSRILNAWFEAQHTQPGPEYRAVRFRVN